ncbi:hypothetical protein [Streptomyces capoamus]|uniref:hypothetical protein n=1 Tax=Streptomyces capoamus TaxID=68183 RepID=UPI0033980CAA
MLTASIPGVQVVNSGSHTIALQAVTVTLPPGGTTAYPETLSPDGQTLAFTDADLAIPTDEAHAAKWVCLSARHCPHRRSQRRIHPRHPNHTLHPRIPAPPPTRKGT